MSAARKLRTTGFKKEPIKKLVALSTYRDYNIVILGNEKLRRKVFPIEKKFDIDLIFSDLNNIKSNITSKTIAIIVDEEMIQGKIKGSINKLLLNYRFYPIFYLARSRKRDSFFKSLYDQGLQGVINWPEESRLLPELVVESFKHHPKALGKTKGDEKLANLIKSHLVLNGQFKNLKVKVIEGFAFIEGSVKSLYDKKIIQLETSKVLGVKKAILEGIKIKEFRKKTDKEIERNIKIYIGNILGAEKRSLAVRVKNKNVRIKGAASSHNDILNIESFIKKQSGVKSISREVQYRPSLVSKTVKKAKFLEQKIKHIFDGVKHISIKVYGDYVEVSGVVRIKENKNLVEQYLLQVLPVKRVINKIYVS